MESDSLKSTERDDDMNLTNRLAQSTKYRAHKWINTETMQPIYSIQARVGKRGWAHLHEKGKPMFFDSETERDAALKELQNG